MTAEQRQQLYDAMMHGVPEDPALLHEFSEMVSDDLKRLEPLIDAMLRDALIQKVKEECTETMNDFSCVVIPDGADCIVRAEADGRTYTFHLARTRLRDFCNFLIAESEK